MGVAILLTVMALPALLCLLLYRALSSSIRRGTFSVLDACFTFCGATLIALPLFMGASTLFALNFIYTNYPDIRPQSWDNSMVFSAVLLVMWTIVVSAIASAISCWKFVRHMGPSRAGPAT
jgi:hypothetical protein